MSIEPKKTEDYDVYEPEKNLGNEAYEIVAMKPTLWWQEWTKDEQMEWIVEL